MTQPSPINFTELENIKPNFDVSAIFICAVIAIIFGVIVVPSLDQDMLELFSLVLPLGAFVIAGMFLYVVVKNKSIAEENERILQRFAVANNLTYLSKAGADGPRSGTLFEHGHSKKFRNVFRGSYQGMPFELSNYQYTVGSGKNRTVYQARVMEFTLPRSMPHMVIDSLVEQDAHRQSTLPIEFDSSQRITLEGDFSQFFQLYAPDNYGVTALTILAPDVMHTLLRSASLCDMEIKDNKLYFYWPGRADTAEEYKTTFETVTAVLNEIGAKLTRSDVFSTPTQAFVHSQPGQGVRLEKSFLSKYGALFIVAAFILAFFMQFAGNSGTFGIIWSSLYFGPIALFGYRAMKRNRLRKSLAERYHQ